MSYAIPFLRPMSGAHPLSGTFAGAGPSAVGGLPASGVETSALVNVAKRLYETRRRRDEVLGASLFSEPAWDILLDLFISYHEDRRLSVSAVCIGAQAPSATALRYLAILQEAGLVVRTRDQSDGRRSHIQLSLAGRQRMAELLAGMVER